MPQLFRLTALGPVVLGVSLALAAPAAPPSSGAASAPRVEGVASENRLATEEALAALRAGGNAVDAAVVAALVAGVASPSSSGLGGGGFALVFLASDRSVTALDFRESAPESVDARALESRPLPDAERGKASGVPGEPAGLYELHRRFGKRAWKDLVAPAERWANLGFPLGSHQAYAISFSESLRKDPDLAALYFPGGKPALVGRRVRNPKLARTLGRLKSEGPRAIYEGSIAADIVESVRAAGGSITREDLAGYRVRERAALRVRWEGLDVFSMPPPSAGGILLGEVLGLFSRDELTRAGLRSGLGVHLVAEAMRGAFADRACCVGDPDHVAVDSAKLLDPARLAARKKRIAADRTHLLQRFLPNEAGTHHLVTADRAGNVVSLTTTVNGAFGADFSAKQSGIVLNDELYDFTPDAEFAKLGLRENPNRARPLARPVSSMMPTIVLRDGRPVLALGGSGGTAIAQSVPQVLLASLVAGETAEAAVALPRFRLGTKDATLFLDDGFSDAVRGDLAWRGEIVRPNTSKGSAVQLIAWSERGLEAAADARKDGSAVAR